VSREEDQFDVAIETPSFTGLDYGYQRKAHFVWVKESLHYMHEEGHIYSLESLRNIPLTDENIATSMNKWYELIGEAKPDYIIDNIQYGYSNRIIELDYVTEKNHRIKIDGRTGEIIDFSGSLTNSERSFSMIEEKILKSKGMNLEQWKRERVSNFWTWRLDKEQIQKLPFTHRFGYDQNDSYFSYSKGIDYFSIPKVRVRNASRDEAYKALAGMLKPMPYAKRAKFSHMIDGDGNITEAWFIVVQPYARAERELYFVDIKTNEVTTVYE
jgi:hypothetical protein